MRVKQKIGKLLIPIISLICSIFYFTPWIFHLFWRPNRLDLIFYEIAMFWFIFAWIIIVVLLISLLKSAKRHEKLDKYKVISILAIMCSYLVIILGMYFVGIVTV